MHLRIICGWSTLKYLKLTKLRIIVSTEVLPYDIRMLFLKLTSYCNSYKWTRKFVSLLRFVSRTEIQFMLVQNIPWWWIYPLRFRISGILTMNSEFACIPSTYLRTLFELNTFRGFITWQNTSPSPLFISTSIRWLQNKKRPVCVAPCDYQKTPSSIFRNSIKLHSTPSALSLCRVSDSPAGFSL